MRQSEATDRDALGRLRRLNIMIGAAHAVQAAVMVVFSNAVALPVTAVFATGPPGQPERVPVIDELFRYRLGPAVALFSALSALFHFVVATPWGFRRYRA